MEGGKRLQEIETTWPSPGLAGSSARHLGPGLLLLPVPIMCCLLRAKQKGLGKLLGRTVPREALGL